jgi:integrase
MASLHRRPRSKYWHAAWRDAVGKLHLRSTKETVRHKAWEIARGWEQVERNASNEAQVRKVMSEILQRNTGQPLRTPTVREWLSNDWLSRKSEKTKKRYSGVVNAFYTFLGDRADRPLKDVTPRDIQKHIDEVKLTNPADKTLSLHLQALKSAFNEARRMQVIDSNPADPVTVIVKDEIERELFTEDEAKLLIDAAEGEWKTLLRIGYYTALRLTTAASLRWEQVDLTERLIRIPKPGKRGKFALIPIHESFFRHLASIAPKAKEGFVTPSLAHLDSGGKRGLSKQFNPIAKKAGVDLREVTRPNGHKFCKRSFHSLRHGFVSGLANQGVAPEQRRAMTGHKTDGAHARYTHLETETLRTAVNKLPAIPE